MSGQRAFGGSHDADPSRASAARSRPGMVLAALVSLVLFGLWKASLAVLVFSRMIRDDQVHARSVPGYLWVIFVALVVEAVLNVVMGVLIFRGVRWAWLATVGLVAVGIAPGLTSIGPSVAARLADLAAFCLVLAVVLHRDVRGWCRPQLPDGTRNPGRG